MLAIEWKTFFKERRKLKRSFPTGTMLFTGAQGKGKTLSASHYIERLKVQYPDVYIYSNIDLSIADKIITPDEIPKYILDKRDVPVIFFLDEIQTVLFAKDSGNKSVSFETLRAIAQQRKAQKTIIGTLQNYLDLDIKYRRQFVGYVECSFFGALQFELWKDGQSLKFDQKAGEYVGRVRDIRLWKRHNKAYDLYDTFQIVDATLNMDFNKEAQHMKQPRSQGSAPT